MVVWLAFFVLGLVSGRRLLHAAILAWLSTCIATIVFMLVTAHSVGMALIIVVPLILMLAIGGAVAAWAGAATRCIVARWRRSTDASSP